MPRQRFWLLWTFGLAGFLVTMPLLSSTVLLMDLDELVEGSDSIIQGEVEAVYSQWDEEKKLIFTYASIWVDESLKGESRRSLLIRQMGGTVGALTLTVAGMPEFQEDTNVIVFLKDSGNGTFQVVGMNQGRYVIVEDFAISNLSGVDLINPKTGLVSGAFVVKKVGLAEFKTQIWELAR